MNEPLYEIGDKVLAPDVGEGGCPYEIVVVLGIRFLSRNEWFPQDSYVYSVRRGRYKRVFPEIFLRPFHD